jgi:ribonucleotide reductase alpha subunit
MNEPFVNKVAESGLITIDLETYLPKGETAVFDLKAHLFMGMILKEKDYREALKNTDWSFYKDKNVALTCSADAIIPVWAWMLAATYLQPVAKEIVMGDEKELHKTLFLKNLAAIDTREFADKKVVIKGCGEIPIGDYVYMEITKLLRPVVKSIMYGEPCSTVPVYKKRP